MACAKALFVSGIVILAIAGARHGAAQTAGQASLEWQPNKDDAVRVAAESNRFVLVHFYSPADLSCQMIERDIYAQPAVRERIQAGFVPFKINVDEAPLTAKLHRVERVPYDFVLDGKGKIVDRIHCPTTPDAYVAALETAAAQAKARAIAAQAALAAAPTHTQQTQTPALAVAPNPAAATIPTATPTQTAALTPSPIQTPIQTPTQPHVTPPVATTISPTPPASRYGDTIAASSVAPVAQTSVQKAQPPAPAIAAYSEDRYAEYYKRWNAPQQASTTAAAPQQQVVTPTTTPPQNMAIVQGPPAMNSQPAATQSPTWGTSNYFTPPSPSQPQPNQTVYNPAPQVAAQTPSAAQAGASPIGLEGFCPVTLAEKQQWVAGDRRWGIVHRGRTYLFAGPEEQRQFQLSPDRYSPAISGRDVVAALDNGQNVDGQRRFGVWYEGRMYLFANETSLQAFKQNRQRYAAVVIQAENPNRTTTVR